MGAYCREHGVLRVVCGCVPRSGSGTSGCTPSGSSAVREPHIDYQATIDRAVQVLSARWHDMRTSGLLERQRMLAQALADAGLLTHDPRDITAIVERNTAVARVDEYRQRLDQVRAERDALAATVQRVRKLHAAWAKENEAAGMDSSKCLGCEAELGDALDDPQEQP